MGQLLLLSDNMDNQKQYNTICEHDYIPIGFEKISTEETKVEVIACIVCHVCGMFRTKILYFDRQKDKTQA